MNRKQRAGQLIRVQKTNRHRFREAVLAALLLLPSTRLVTVAALAPRLVHALQLVQVRGKELARQHAQARAKISDEQHRAQRLALEAAAAGLAAPLLRSMVGRVLGDPEAQLADLARQAVREAEARIELTADTELFRSYNEEWLAAVEQTEPQATLVWVAILDKRTCDRCAALDGMTTKANVGFEYPPPLHGRCRCYVEVE